MTEAIQPGRSPEDLAALPTVFRDGLFADQVVLITGAAGGIGTATSVLFGRLGATVVGCGRDAEKLARWAASLTPLGIRADPHAMSVRDPEQVEKLVQGVWERYGRLDVLINNAGGQFAAPSTEITPRGWHAVVETNLTGGWYMMQAAARRWEAAGQGGSVVNITAVVDRAMPGVAHTVAARAGMHGLTRTLAVEWAPMGVRVNCVAVGVVNSPGLVHYPEAARPSFTANPMRRMGDVQDIAEACAYLSAPAARFVTGVMLPVDGGFHAWGEYWPLGKPGHFADEDRQPSPSGAAPPSPEEAP